MIHHSEQSTQQCAHIWSDNNPTSLHKEVEGYMGSDDLQLPCVQPPTSSYNPQLLHGRHGHGGSVGHGGLGGHGDRVWYGGHGGHVGHVGHVVCGQLRS